MSLKNPSRSLIKNLVSRIVITDDEEKDVKVYLKFKHLEEIVNAKLHA